MTTHRGTSARPAHRVNPGDLLAPRRLTTIQGGSVLVPDPDRLVHLQFRRFASCPICNLHLRSVTRRHDEIVEAGISEVAVFHSTVEEMLRYQGELPFATIADPRRRLYADFGLETSFWRILRPRVIATTLRGLVTGKGRPPTDGETILGLPGDFLIAPDGRVLARKYGRHADDQWTVDELLRLAGEMA